MSKLLWRVIVVFILPLSVAAQNPCSELHSRALVMGGGGSKGAFQAGAVYYLIVLRGCDFNEISGTSVGALNGAVLAQAQTETDPANSIERLRTQTHSLVSMWENIRSSKDVVKGRPMATTRLGLFGLESLKNFEPLRKMLAKNVFPERLQDGRPLRVGTVSFHDGRYHEIVLNADGKLKPNAIDHLFGSAILPMFGTMPRIPVETTSSKREAVQFGDGALRHTIPLNSYFQVCGRGHGSKEAAERCWSVDGSINPSHEKVEQLFVIATSPYERGQLVRPVVDPKAFTPNSQQIRDGRKVMARALDLLMDTMYRSDLDSAYLHNDLLRWQADQARAQDGATLFPVRSYNVLPEEQTLAPRPYVMAVIVPEKEDAEITAMLDFSPKRISEQLYCGCMAADRMMQEQFRAESMAGSCKERFRPKTSNAKSKDITPSFFAPEICAGPESSRRLAQAPLPNASTESSAGQLQ